MKQLIKNVIAAFMYIGAIVILRDMPMDGEEGKFAILIVIAHLLFLAGQSFASPEARSKMWQSFALYVLAQTVFAYYGLHTPIWGQFIVMVMFLAIGTYHTYLIDDAILFSDEDKPEDNQPEINPDRKYQICWVLSVIALMIAYLS